MVDRLSVSHIGDKVYSINGQSITRCSLEQVQRLLLMRYALCYDNCPVDHMIFYSHQGMVLQVSPKNDDVLQLFVSYYGDRIVSLCHYK